MQISASFFKLRPTSSTTPSMWERLGIRLPGTRGVPTEMMKTSVSPMGMVPWTLRVPVRICCFSRTCNLSSKKWGSPRLSRSTTSWLTSTPSTSQPDSARTTESVSPTYPIPAIQTFSSAIRNPLKPRSHRGLVSHESLHYRLRAAEAAASTQIARDVGGHHADAR